MPCRSRADDERSAAGPRADQDLAAAAHRAGADPPGGLLPVAARAAADRGGDRGHAGHAVPGSGRAAGGEGARLRGQPGLPAASRGRHRLVPPDRRPRTSCSRPACRVWPRDFSSPRRRAGTSWWCARPREVRSISPRPWTDRSCPMSSVRSRETTPCCSSPGIPRAGTGSPPVCWTWPTADGTPPRQRPPSRRPRPGLTARSPAPASVARHRPAQTCTDQHDQHRPIRICTT